MKTLIVYYSLEGSTHLIAETIASAIHADVLRLLPKDDIKSKGFMKYVWGGKAVVMGDIPELISFEKDPEQYDLIILGTPVWAFGPSPAMISFLKQASISGKKIAFFCCHGGGGKATTFTKMKKFLPACDVLGEIQFLDPAKKKSEEKVNQAVSWAKGLI